MSQQQTTRGRAQAEAPTHEKALAMIWSEALLSATHDPLEAARLRQGHALLEACDVLLWREVEVEPPDMALGAPPALAAFHGGTYIESVEALSQGQATLWSAQALGFGPEITLPFPGMSEQARAYVAAARTAVRCLVEGRATLAASIAGNQPHAAVSRSINGDVFNDVLLALQDARAVYEKVAFVTLEAEYPVAVATHFAQDPGLLFMSLHEGPAYLYPGAGHTREIGEGDGRGYTVNLPLAPGSGPTAPRRFWRELAQPLLEQFEPDILVLLLGATAHYLEPLAHLSFTIDSYVELVSDIAALAPRLALLGGDGSLPFLSAELWTATVAALVGRRNGLPRRVPARFSDRFGPTQWNEQHDAAPRADSLERFAALELDRALYDVQHALASIWSLPLTVPAPTEWEAPSFAVASLAPEPVAGPREELPPSNSTIQPRPLRAQPTRADSQTVPSPRAVEPPQMEQPPRPPERSKKSRDKRRRRRGERRESSRGGRSGGS